VRSRFQHSVNRSRRRLPPSAHTSTPPQHTEHISPILYSTTEQGNDPSALSVTVTARLRQLLSPPAQPPTPQQQQKLPDAPALSAGLSRALCCIHRFQRAQHGSSSSLGSGGTAAAAAAGGGNAAPPSVAGVSSVARQRSKPRVLVLAGSDDVPVQYIPTMNAIFSAQHAGVAIDALVVGGEDSAFLQQGAHITGGLYLRPSKPEGLLQYLLTVFAAGEGASFCGGIGGGEEEETSDLAARYKSALHFLPHTPELPPKPYLKPQPQDTTTRAYLNLYQPTGVDYRASCFCHKRVIDTGFICSVCLSIFCKDNMRLPQCPTCKSVFARGAGGGAAAAAGWSSGGGGGAAGEAGGA